MRCENNETLPGEPSQPHAENTETRRAAETENVGDQMIAQEGNMRIKFSLQANVMKFIASVRAKKLY